MLAYIKTGDVIRGPFAMSQIKKMSENGIITADSYYRIGDDGEWLSVIDLFEDFHREDKGGGGSSFKHLEQHKAKSRESSPRHVDSKSQEKVKLGCSVIFILVLGWLVYEMVNPSDPSPPPPLTPQEQISGRAPEEIGEQYWSVKSYLKGNMKDPDSLEIISFTKQRRSLLME